MTIASVGSMIHQLRMYEIFEHNKAAFHARFRDHAWRTMRTYGFEVVAFWETSTDTGPVFVYLLQWPGEATMTESWAAFLADQEWKDVKRETAAAHGDLVGDVSSYVLTPTEYSPMPTR